MLQHGSIILETARHAFGELDELRVAPRGRVILGLPTRVANVLTKILVQAFRRQFPEASISVAEGGSAVLHEWLTLGRVDIALLFDPPYTAELDVELVHSEELVLVGPRVSGKQLPESTPFRQLQSYPLILPRIPNATRTIVDAAATRHKVELNVCVEVDTTANILDLVASRLGYGILSGGAVRAVGGYARYGVSRIESPVLYNQLYIATNRHRMYTKLVEELRKVIKQIDVSAHLQRPTAGDARGQAV
ncbi:MAG TPA: LysR substrate-binding domain-containing protein [Burkholderiaceae bacterium]|nr:LysR substrate-binding domain-containing protein [Burkholderiaceae bacterium]